MSSCPAERSASRLTTLPARPPTPPRDTSATDVFSPDTTKTVEDALRFLDEGHLEPAPSSGINISVDTPPSKALASSARGSTATKKVGFVLEPANQPQSSARLGSPRVSHDSPASRSAGPLKSILKRSIEELPPTPDDVESRLSYFSPQEPGSFRKMLQSVLKQLGGTSRDGRRDAYLCLNGALKQYSDLPEREALVDKMNLLQQFIARDMAWKDSKGGLDLQIVTQAINLTSVLISEATTEQALDEDFRAFVIDRSLVLLEQTDAPKPVLKAHLHILMVQDFPSDIMTPGKAERILTALQTIEERCTGNSVVAARLNVFQRLAAQQPSLMLNRMQDWMGYIFTGMLSSITDIRVRAIDACQYAALRLGSYPLASRTLCELFDAEIDEGVSYCEYFNKKLMEMTSDKELAHFVPQIWATIILFFRSKRKPLDRWPKLRPFLATIQRCLNSGDINVKHQAHIAWHKLMFVVMPESSTTPTMRSMLRLPIVTLLERRGNDRFSQQAKELALQSYCHLLNYGLRPTLSHDDLDGNFKLYVEEVVEALVKSSRRGPAHACRVVHGFLQRKKGPWNENAALEPNTPLKPEELPQLDAKWIRSRVGRIIKTLEPIIVAGMCSPPETNEAANECWRMLFQAVAEAGSQEVKTSNELKVALAEVINFLRRLWHAPAASRTEVEASMWLDRYQLLLKTCVDAIGAGHFVEDFLAKTNADEVEATPTPSNRTSKHQKTAYSPFVFLFALYYQPPNQSSSESYAHSAAWFLGLLAEARGSASGAIGLLHRSLQFCADQTPPESLGEQLWGVVADSAANALAKQLSTLPQHNAQTLGVALRSALNIITFGLRNYKGSLICPSKASYLYAAACHFAKQYGNDSGVALGVMEPLAKSLIDMQDDLSITASLELGKAIMEHGVWPKSRQDLEQGRKALWSVSLDPPSKTPAAVFDPFDQVYSCMNALSRHCYDQLKDLDGTECAELLSDYLKAVVNFLQTCPQKTLPSSFRRLQDTVAVFAEDRNRTLFPLSTPWTDNTICEAAIEIYTLWADVLRLVQVSISPKDSSLLESLETLLVAGFASPSKDIVNETITFWNESFAAQDSLDYPPRLLPVLRARRMDADLQLPGLADDNSDIELVELPAFAESQSTSLDSKHSPHVVGRSPRPTSKASNFLFNSPIASLASFRTTSASKRAKSSKKSTPKTRLRHDNSQLEFAPIESSSAQSAVEESQLLTEHQKEVKARQHGDAQMFPDLSSSPQKSELKGRAVAKKLDFSSDAARGETGNESVATPTGLADTNPMSDDLPSSPTPRASAAAHEVDPCSDDDATDIIDPPSSPPREADQLPDDDVDRVDETTIDIDDGAVGRNALEQPGTGHEQIGGEADLDDSRVIASDLGSDSILPTAQLEREAAAAEAQRGTQADVQQVNSTDEERNGNEDGSEYQHSQTPSRVEESFIERIDTATPSNADSAASTPRDSRSKRKKRRQAEDEADGPRKRAKKSSPSPIKDLWRRLTSTQNTPQTHEDDDIGDEIVVSDKRHTLPATEPGDRSSHSRPDQEPEQEASTESQEEKHIKRRRGRPRKSYSQESEPAAESQETSQPPIKRGRGRSRKYPVGESSQTSATSKGLKRRASVVSNTTTEERGDASYVADTPALPVTRKAARLSQGTSDAGSCFRRAVTHEEADEEGQEQQTSAIGTPSPKNILARLYGVLADIPKMVFRSQEERDFDDVLFQIRREVHEASRRSRDQ